APMVISDSLTPCRAIRWLVLACLMANGAALAQEKPGDADLCYRTVTQQKVTPGAVLAACSRVIAAGNRGKAELAMAHANRGALLLHAGGLDAAIADSPEARPRERDSAMARATRGEAYRLSRRYEEAVADEDAAIKLDPKLELAYLDRAAAYAATERW